MEKGHIKISASRDYEHNKLKFMFEDTGIGMTNEQMQILFTPYTQKID